MQSISKIIINIFSLNGWRYMNGHSITNPNNLHNLYLVFYFIFYFYLHFCILNNFYWSTVDLQG